MQGHKKRIHLDRVEILAVFVVLVLSHGLLYVLGVLSGFGLHPQSGSGPHLSDAAHEVAGHGEAKNEHGNSRSPASHADSKNSKDSSPGSELRRAYRESKQQAFVEMNLRKDTNQKPKSVTAAEAHLEAHPDWDRKPPEVAEAPAESELKRDPAGHKEPSNQNAVKRLFERRPASIDYFEPRPGFYTVQIASYATSEEAEAKISELRGVGFNEAYIQRVSNGKGNQWHRVAVGSFPSPDWAKKTGDKLIRRKMAHDFIVKQVQ